MTILCGLIVWIEHFKYSFIGTRRLFPLGAQCEDGVVSFVSVLVDLSRRRHHTIKSGSVSERLGWNQRIHIYLAPPVPFIFLGVYRYRGSGTWEEPAVVPLGQSGSTAYSLKQ